VGLELTMPLILPLLILLLSTPATAQVAKLQHALLRNGAYVLPPTEYDHDYDKPLGTTRAKSLELVRQLCNRRLSQGLGCAHRFPTGCWIIMASDELIQAAGWEPDIVRRHEIGHCNGWPEDHKGARLAPRKKPGLLPGLSASGHPLP
jgi:hypothetical protein